MKILMKFLITLILIGQLNNLYSEKIKLSRETFRGVWENDDETNDIFIITGNYKICIYKYSDGNISVNFYIYGFISSEDNDKYSAGIEPYRCLPVKNLKDSGEYLVVYMEENFPDNCLPRPRTLYYDYYIDEPNSPNIDFVYMHFLHYTRVNCLDSTTEHYVLKALKEKGLTMPGNYIYNSWKHYGRVKLAKVMIYSEPEKPTKMYLIEGDVFKIIEEKDDWIYIEFIGKKGIKGWVRKKDVSIVK